MRFALVKDGVIRNIVIVSAERPWVQPRGVDAHLLEEGAFAAIGLAWGENGPVVPPKVEPPVPTLKERLAAAGIDMDELQEALSTRIKRDLLKE